MRWIRPTRLPILIAWMAILGAVAWFGTHPKIVAPFFSKIVSRQLMHTGGGSIRVTDFKIRPFEGMDLYGVSLSLPGRNRGMTLISADTMIVDFTLGDVVGGTPRIRRVAIDRPEVYSRLGGAGERPEREDEGFTRLVIDQLEIRNAFLEFSGSDGRLVERLSHVDWYGSLRSGNQLHLTLHGCDVAWDTHESLLTELRGEVVIDRQELSVPRAFGKLNGKQVEVEGFRRWDGLLDIAVDGRGVSIAEVENLIDLTIGFKARGDLQGTFFARGDTVIYSGLFNGDLEGYQMSNLVGKAVITDGLVSVSGISGRVNGALFEGVGEFVVDDPENVSFVLEGDVRDANLANNLVPETEDLPRTDGWGHLKIEHTMLPEWTRVSGMLHDGFIEIAPFDSCRIDVVAMPDTLVFQGIDLFYGPLHANLVGDSDRDLVFRGHLRAETNDLAQLPANWKVPPLTGWARAEGDLEGPLENLGFVGHAFTGDVTLANASTRRAEASVVIRNVLEDPFVAADVQGSELQIGGVDLGNFQALGSASAQAARIDSFHAVLGDTNVALSFRAGFSDTIQQFALDRFEVTLEGTRWAMVEPSRFSIGPGHFSLPNLRIESDQGALTAAGEYDDDQRFLGGDLRLRGFDLGLLDPFVANDEPLRGRLTADVTVGGEPEEPVVVLSGDLVQAPFPLARIDSLHFAASYSQGTVAFEELDLTTDYGRVWGQGEVTHLHAGVKEFWPGAELDLDLHVVDGDWSFMDQFELPALERIAGEFSGSVKVAGTTDDPLLRGDVHSSPFHIHWLHLDELEGKVWADRSSLVLGDLFGRKEELDLTGRIEIPLELDFLNVPIAPPQGPFYMQLSVPPGSSLAPLSRATNAFVQTSGTGSGNVVVSGPLEHPLYQGQIEIEDGGFVIRDMEEVYHGVSATGVFEGDVLRLDNIRGEEGLRGKLAGSGSLNFEGLLLKGVDVRLELDRFLLATVPDLRVVFNSSNARISSAYAGPDSLLVPKFSGSMEVLKGRYTGDFKEKPGQVDPMAATVAPEWLADLQLHGDPRTVRILNREMELYLGGDLDLIRDLEGLYLRGTLDVNAGRLIVFNNTFNVERGRLDFSRDLGFDPLIDVDAVTKHRLRSRFSNNSVIENISVHVGATLTNPEISFSSDQGYSREAIQRMLLGLDPYPGVTGGEVDQLRASSITAGFNVLEREIAQELNLVDTFEIDQIRREKESGETGLDPLIGIGKYIGSDLYLKVAQGVKQEDRDIIVEYQINRHLLLQSEIRRRIDENQGQETYNLDLKYRFEY